MEATGLGAGGSRCGFSFVRDGSRAVHGAVRNGGIRLVNASDALNSAPDTSAPSTSSRLGRLPMPEEYETCTACPLHETRARVVPGYGALDARIAVVGEAPGADEDREGKPFVGPSGQLLRQVLTAAGVREEWLFFTNVYHCRPPGNDISLAKDSPCPSIWTATELGKLYLTAGTRVILATGGTAIRHFRPINDYPGAEEMTVRDAVRHDTRWPDRRTGPFWVVGMYHPSACLRAGGIREGNVILVSMVDSILRAVAYAQ